MGVDSFNSNYTNYDANGINNNLLSSLRNNFTQINYTIQKEEEPESL